MTGPGGTAVRAAPARGCPSARRGWRVAVAGLTVGSTLLTAAAASTPVPARTIVLIGGVGTEAPGRHEYARGVDRLAALLQQHLRSRRDAPRLAIVRHRDGWPADPKAFDRASTIVLYCDGEARHPLRDAALRHRFEAAMARGVGLVVLHQASTVTADDREIGLVRWLGGERRGLFDRTTETVTLEPASPEHAASRGLAAFTVRDEFYPTLHFAAQAVVPLLTATLHVQVRDGRAVVDDLPERRIVAWAHERAEGGRAVGYTGAHALEALEEPMLQRLLVNAVMWTSGLDPKPSPLPEADRAAPARTPAHPSRSPDDVTTFHRDPGRSGWNRREATLSPQAITAGFGATWSSPPFDTVDDLPPRLYASPLYVDRVRVTAGPHQGQDFSVVFAASSNGEVRAVNAARAGDLAPGRVLWRTRLALPCRLQPAPLDGVATGVLSTPVIDVERQRIYVAHCDPVRRWQAYALELGSGRVLPGWPVRLDEGALNAANRNAGPAPVPPRRRFDFRVQRGALNLSPDGRRLYVTFGETETGWLVSVDTEAARIASAFATQAMPHRGSGGIWGAGGPAVDGRGRVYVVTGSGFEGYLDQAHDWTQSLLQLTDADGSGLRLAGTYTPFNHCRSAAMDIDLGSGGVALLPVAPGAAAPLLVVGGKQGNAYLLDGDRLPGRLDRRPPCTDDASSDGSLLAPEAQPQFGGRGPLNVFGPYSERDAALDTARSRSLPAAFRGADGVLSVLMTGNTRAGEGSPEAVPPSLVRLQVVDEGRPGAHLRVARAQDEVVFGNPGSPVVSSDGARQAVVWVLDENARRSAPLHGPGGPSPVLHAFDAETLRPLWRSPPGALQASGKYNQPLIVKGQVIVGTDRLQAFGLGGTAAVPPRPGAAAGSGATDAAALFARRCAACHDAPQGNVPPRALIAERPLARIVGALTHGSMQPHAAGLAAGEIDALARFLRGEPVTTGAPR